MTKKHREANLESNKERNSKIKNRENKSCSSVGDCSVAAFSTFKTHFTAPQREREKERESIPLIDIGQWGYSLKSCVFFIFYLSIIYFLRLCYVALYVAVYELGK